MGGTREGRKEMQEMESDQAMPNPLTSVVGAPLSGEDARLSPPGVALTRSRNGRGFGICNLFPTFVNTSVKSTYRNILTTVRCIHLVTLTC